MGETVGPDQQPWANIRSASTTQSDGVGKIRRPRRAQSSRRRQAPPHPLAQRHGAVTPVTMTLRIRQGADLWLEVITDHGRFFCAFDVSAFDLVQQVIRGGHQVEVLGAIDELTHRRGKGRLSEALRSSGEETSGS